MRPSSALSSTIVGPVEQRNDHRTANFAPSAVQISAGFWLDRSLDGYTMDLLLTGILIGILLSATFLRH
jgi:hypothetical protein